MRQGFKSEHWDDADGNPAGGSTYGVGFAISWQNGPLGLCTCGLPPEGQQFGQVISTGHGPSCARRQPNGAFVEDVIAAAVDRLQYYQGSRYADGHNASAIEHLEMALVFLNTRTVQRQTAGVEGSHQVTPA